MALFATMLGLLLFSRAVFAFPILAIHNRLSKEPLTLREVVVAWRAPPRLRPPARPPARPRTSAAAPTPGVAQELIIARCVPRALDRPALPHAPAAALAQGPAHRASQDRDGAAACTHSLSGG